MEIKGGVMVPLGYGKFARSDKIISLERIEDERGPGRRTIVHVEEVKTPIIASRTENAIIEGMVETPRNELEASAALELLYDIRDDLQQIGPMLRKSIKKEANFDIDRTEKRINEILLREIDFEEIH
jgi:hypothetical protein